MGSSSTGAKEEMAPSVEENNDKDETTANAEEENLEEDMSPTPLFKEGDKVLAYHGPLIYEAKVQRAEIRKKEWKYFVHYLGWSKNWDEWVGPDRLMDITEDNRRKQEELLKNKSADKNFKGRVAQSRPRSLTDAKLEKEDVKNYVARGRKRKGDSGAEEKDGESPEKMVKISLPTTLKKQLVDDWEFVTQLGKLVKLPRNPTVDDILKKYLEHKTKKEGMVGDSVVEILNGLRSYFDKALPSMLLYKQERQQYSEVVPESSNVAPSTVYGAEHLLRLFVKLPELLVYVNMEEEALTQLQQKLLDFLKFLQKNQSSFFLSSYDGPKVPPDVESREKTVAGKLSSARYCVAPPSPPWLPPLRLKMLEMVADDWQLQDCSAAEDPSILSNLTNSAPYSRISFFLQSRHILTDRNRWPYENGSTRIAGKNEWRRGGGELAEVAVCLVVLVAGSLHRRRPSVLF